MNKALEQLKRETKNDVGLFACLEKLYQHGFTYAELKTLIPQLQQAKEQQRFRRILQSNNEALLSMFSKEMSLLLDAKERQEEEEFRKLDRLIRQQQTYRKAVGSARPAERLKRFFLPA